MGIFRFCNVDIKHYTFCVHIHFFLKVPSHKSYVSTAKDPFENCGHLLQIVFQREALVKFFGGEVAHDGFVLCEEFFVVLSFEPGLHGDGLHEVVCAFAGEALVDEGGHDTLREDDLVGQVDVFQHVLRENDEVFEDVTEAVEHVVEEDSGVWEHDALSGGVGDVALVPERDVLVGADHVAAEDSRAAAHVLAADGVALVGHRGGSFLTLSEGLLGLAEFRTLPVAHFDGHLLHGGGDERESAHIVGVAVALQHLRGDTGGMDAELLADVVLHERWGVGEVAYSAADLAALHIGGGHLETLDVAAHLLEPQCPLQSEGGDVGVYAVRAPDARRVLELVSAFLENLDEPLEILAQYVVGLLDEVSVGGIDHIGGGEPVVYPLLLVAETLAHGAGERHDVVAGLLLDFVYALHVESRLRAQFLNVFSRNHAELAPRGGGFDFHFQIGTEFVFLSPDGAHLRTRITGYHNRKIFAAKIRNNVE